MKLALVHDHLNQLGGAEKVLEVFTKIFPEAPIYTLIYDEEKTRGVFRGEEIHESFIARFPFAQKKFRWYLPMMIAATEAYDLSSYDVVLSDSSGLAKGVITGPKTLHICYCHTPTRYLWSDHTIVIDKLERNWLVGRLSQLYRSYLRVWDRQAADRVDIFIANSKFVSHRIRKYYKAESTVVHPPVKIDDFSIRDDVGNYYLIVSRLRPYKRVDLAVQAFNRLGLPLKIAGSGEEEERLKKMARPNIEFLGNISEAQKRDLLSRSRALVHPQEEDFGITPIEAMASGRPVIAYAVGGALESIVPGKTGVLFDEQSWEALADAVIRFKPGSFSPAVIREHARTFDESVFMAKMKRLVEQSWQTFKNTIY